MSASMFSDDLIVPMVEIIYRPHVRLSKRAAISSLNSAGFIFYNAWKKETPSPDKPVRIMLLGRGYEVLGMYELFDSIGDIVSDPRRIILAALRANAYAICIARFTGENVLAANDIDKKLLKKAIQVARLFQIDVWDYVIVGKTAFFSFRKHGLLSDTLINDRLLPPVQQVKTDFVKPVSREIDVSGIVFEPEKLHTVEKNGKTPAVSNSGPNNLACAVTGCTTNIDDITNHLRDFIDILPDVPFLTKGRVRRLKIMSATRGYTVQNELYQNVYRTTSRIYLIGDWIAKTGLNCHDRIKVIPMHRLLIIAPDDKKE